MSVLWAQRRDRPRPARGIRGLATSVFGRQRPVAPRSGPTMLPVANGTHHRPSPSRRWTDATTAPDGDFAASAITNAALARTDVPEPGDTWEAVSDFALSYDGYAYWDDLPELANRCVQRWTRDRSLPATIDELRGCLFYEQRRWHHFGGDPAGRSAEYMAALVDALRALTPRVTRRATPAVDPGVGAMPHPHVKVVRITTSNAPGMARAAAAATLEDPIGAEAPVLRPVAGSFPRLTPVPASEAHVKLVAPTANGSRSSERVTLGRTAMPAAWVRPPLAAVGARRPGGIATHALGRAPPQAAGHRPAHAARTIEHRQPQRRGDLAAAGLVTL